jgi:hypothetical protein
LRKRDTLGDGNHDTKVIVIATLLFLHAIKPHLRRETKVRSHYKLLSSYEPLQHIDIVLIRGGCSFGLFDADPFLVKAKMCRLTPFVIIYENAWVERGRITFAKHGGFKYVEEPFAITTLSQGNHHHRDVDSEEGTISGSTRCGKVIIVAEEKRVNIFMDDFPHLV